MTETVTKQMMIGELLQIDSKIAPFLMEIGMGCIGLSFSPNGND